MALNCASDLEHQIEEKLSELERNGADREAVADTLERYAETVRNGYTRLPHNRGEWWAEVRQPGTEGELVRGSPATSQAD